MKDKYVCPHCKSDAVKEKEEVCHCHTEEKEEVCHCHTEEKEEVCHCHTEEKEEVCHCHTEEKEEVCHCHKNETETCCHHEKEGTPCGCCGEKKKNGSLKNDLIILAVSLVFLVAGFFDYKHMGINFLYYVNPAYITVILCGYPIIKSAIKNLAKKKITSSLLISVAIIASIALEIVGFFTTTNSGAHSHSYVFAAGEVAFLMALGEIIENLTVKKTRSGIDRLAALIPKTAFIKTENGLKEVEVEKIKIGDVVVVKAGETISVDGEICGGEASVDFSSVTGESLPVDCSEGDHVFAGTLSVSGAIEIKVTKLYKDMTVAKMAEMVEEASGKKAPISRLADKWAGYIVPAAVILSVIVGLLTLLLLNMSPVNSLIRAVTVLVVFCPCSLALATPTAIAAAIGNCAGNGVMVKSGASIEEMSKINAICFDKTGTLTEGVIEVSGTETDGIDEREFVNLVASAETYSEHPLAKAIVSFADKDKLVTPLNLKTVTGKGIEAEVDGHKVIASSFTSAEKEYEISEKLRLFADKSFAEGRTVIIGIIDGKAKGAIAFSDRIRENAKDVIGELNQKGYETVMLTGDNGRSAEYIAKECGITTVKHSLMPEQKLQEITDMKNSGKKVCMIGDGINDAPALKIADCSMAMGALGSDIAVETADMSILTSDLSKLADTLELSKKTLSTIKRNILFSMSINLLAVIGSFFGILTPVTGAVVHNCSSVLVVLNSALLLRKKQRLNK